MICDPSQLVRMTAGKNISCLFRTKNEDDDDVPIESSLQKKCFEEISNSLTELIITVVRTINFNGEV